MINSISNHRKEIIKLFLKYFNKKKKEGINVFLSPFVYPCTWFRNLGYMKLQSFYLKNNQRLIFQYIREFIYIAKLHDYKLKEPRVLNYSIPKNLYISWFNVDDIDKNFKFKDKYIPLLTKKNNYWFLLNIGKYFKYSNTKKNKSFFIFQKVTDKTFNYIYLIKIFLKVVLRNKFSLMKTMHQLNIDSVFSEIVVKDICNMIKKYNIKKIILPYEAQPFQKYLISILRKEFKTVKIVGYLNAIQPFPIHLFDNSNLPDKIYSSSPAQIKHLSNFFKWDRKKIFLKKSFRFEKKKSKFKNKILLPFIITDPKIIIKTIYNLINIKPKNYFSKIDVIPHPSGILGKDYKKFVNDLNEILKSFDKKFDKKNKKNMSLVVGSTSVIFEALELGLEVIHIVDQPALESLDERFWPTVKILKFNENVYKYTAEVNKSLIHH